MWGDIYLRLCMESGSIHGESLSLLGGRMWSGDFVSGLRGVLAIVCWVFWVEVGSVGGLPGSSSGLRWGGGDVGMIFIKLSPPEYFG